MVRCERKLLLIIRFRGFYQCLMILCVPVISYLHAESYFVAPDGDNSNSGSIEAPFASLNKGVDKAAAGDTVYIRGGTYAMNAGISITKSGSSDLKRICIWAFQNEKPVFDFSAVTSQTNGVTVRNSKWLHFKGLEFCNVPQLSGATPNCVLCDRSGHIVFEQCNFHHNGGTGLFISYGIGGHLVLNCDSHDNYDPKSSQGDGQNADGFGVHYQTAGTDTTIIRGCRAWWNSDDGFDCIHQNVAVIVENCWVWLHGYKPGTMTRAPSGNGQGIKGGGYNLPPDRVPAEVPQNIIRFCVSFLNGDKGFNANYHPAACLWYNNTSFNNKGGNYYMQGITISGSDYSMTPRGILKNNIAFKGTAISGGTGDNIEASNNSWNLSDVSISNADFISIDTTGIYGPRKEDGSLPEVKFLRPAAGSELIDKGVDMGFPFSGKAPDLGAFEYRDPASVTSDAPSRSALQSITITGLPGMIGAEESPACDLSGRRMPPGMIEKRSCFFIRVSRTPCGLPQRSPIVRMQ